MFDGAGWSVGLATVLFVFALLVVVMEFESPDIVLWTGHHAVGTELTVGLTRKRRWTRRQMRGASRGLDPDFAARQLKARRGGHTGGQ
ncbi:MAG TPA: hypothetical protein VMV92_31340 [Streptosporangiaceae bacterium]|nr:hypothetical protein [Streptosporangiaceae bacterium]